MTFRFVISRDGKVTSARIADCTLPDCAIATCIRAPFKTISFPQPEGGVPAFYPIMLEPG